METKDKIQIVGLILIAIFIIVLIVSIVVLVKNVDEIKSDPVQYSIDKDFYNSCSCYDKDMNTRVYGNKMVIQNWTG